MPYVGLGSQENQNFQKVKEDFKFLLYLRLFTLWQFQLSRMKGRIAILTNQAKGWFPPGWFTTLDNIYGKYSEQELKKSR